VLAVHRKNGCCGKTEELEKGYKRNMEDQCLVFPAAWHGQVVAVKVLNRHRRQGLAPAPGDTADAGLAQAARPFASRKNRSRTLKFARTQASRTTYSRHLQMRIGFGVRQSVLRVV